MPSQGFTLGDLLPGETVHMRNYLITFPCRFDTDICVF